MASDLQRRKVTTVFTAMDADSDGFLTESDFTALTARWTAIRGGDDLVTPDEYNRMIEAWRGTPTDTDTIFPLLDSDGDGRLSRSEFREHWYEFWAGDDASAPGTFVFGPLS